MNTAFWWLSLVASGIWPLSFVFVEPLAAQHFSNWLFLAVLELPRWLNIVWVDMDIPTFGCTVLFNPWYDDFISGLSSCENQPPSSWWIVKLLSLLWVKNCKWSHWKPFVCGLQYSTELSCFMAKPSALIILCGLCSWKNIHGGHGWQGILKYYYCTAYANIIHISKLR
jgi:hypothetical protein